MKKNDKLLNVANKQLCCACGTCEAICPKRAISFKEKNSEYKPVINSACSFCKACLKVCPFENFTIRNDTLIGNYLNLFKARSVDKEILNLSTSGGIVSQLLLYLFQAGLINYAILVDYDINNPIIAKGVIVKKTKDVITCAGSKYQQVVINKFLRGVKKKDKFAIVGLPCHLKGLDKYIKLKKLNTKNIYRIGLFCGHVVNFKYFDYLFKKIKIKKEKIKLFNYRTRGWPGNLLIKTEKKTYLFSLKTFFKNIYSARFFTPECCFYCDDLTAELSDISCGDAWGIARDKSSLVIVRNKKIIPILRKLKDKLELISLTEKDIIKSQGSQLFFKKKNIFARVYLHNLIAKEKISYKQSKRIKCSFIDYVGAAILLLSRQFSVKFLLYLPPFLLYLYAKLVSYTTGFYYKRLMNKFKIIK